MDKKKLDDYNEFIDNLDLDKLKYDISEELGSTLADKAGLLLDEAERAREIIPPDIAVNFSSDKLKAYLKVVTPGKPIAVTEDDIRKCLKENGIRKGILEKSIEEVLVEQLIGQEVLIAQGVMPEHGKDGFLRSLLDDKKTSPEACVDSTGRVDFKQMRLSNIVEIGESIAEKIPPTKGRSGFDVTGKILPPRPGKEVKLTLTSDIGIMPHNTNLLVALKNGILKRDFTIDELNFINGDVDFSTGNIRYAKSLVVKGDVKTGFSVYCGENVEIRGCVEDAEVVAEGDVVVKQGLIGTNKGLIKGKNVTIGHIKAQRVVASGDIIVGGEVIHGTLEAGGFIKMLGIRGMAIGGTFIAEKGIEVMNVGNAQNVRTNLHVGHNGEIQKLEDELEKKKKNLVKLETALRIFKAAAAVREISEGKKKMMETIQTSKNSLAEEIEKLETKRIETIEDLLRRENPYIKVVQNVFSNTTIQIGHLKKYITTGLVNKRFCYHKNTIFTGI